MLLRDVQEFSKSQIPLVGLSGKHGTSLSAALQEQSGSHAGVALQPTLRPCHLLLKSFKQPYNSALLETALSAHRALQAQLQVLTLCESETREVR